MQCFKDCKDYDDYLKIIYEEIKSKKLPIKEENQEGLKKLLSIKEEEIQKKIIKLFNRIDKELSYSRTNSNEMYKKINYLLVIGTLATKYIELFNKLTEEELFILIYGEFSSINENNEEYLNIFANKEILEEVKNIEERKKEKNKMSLFGYSDTFFMMIEHYQKTNKKELNVEEFQKEMIKKMKSDTLHEGVKDMLEFWNSEEIEELRRKNL